MSVLNTQDRRSFLAIFQQIADQVARARSQIVHERASFCGFLLATLRKSGPEL